MICLACGNHCKTCASATKCSICLSPSLKMEDGTCQVEEGNTRMSTVALVIYCALIIFAVVGTLGLLYYKAPLCLKRFRRKQKKSKIKPLHSTAKGKYVVRPKIYTPPGVFPAQSLPLKVSLKAYKKTESKLKHNNSI